MESEEVATVSIRCPLPLENSAINRLAPYPFLPQRFHQNARLLYKKT